KQLMTGCEAEKAAPVFVSQQRKPLTRFGIYKIVKRHTAALKCGALGEKLGGASPHVFRHSAAVHLLEAGVDVNVIRGWLGHVNLETTNRYAEINTRMKEAALRLCEPPVTDSDSSHRTRVWRDDQALLAWLASL